MATCLNCGNRLSCGCKKRTASDGKSCCVKCLTQYENSLKKKTNNKSAKIDTGIVIINATAIQKEINIE